MREFSKKIFHVDGYKNLITFVYMYHKYMNNACRYIHMMMMTIVSVITSSLEISLISKITTIMQIPCLMIS